MVFCRCCGKEIHETALACPQCGGFSTPLSLHILTEQPMARFGFLSPRWFSESFVSLVSPINRIGTNTRSSGSSVFQWLALLLAPLV